MAARRARAGVRHALPADDAAGDGQGRRGHRLLPLRAPARAQRGRRRPEPLRHRGRGVPRRQPRARRALPAQPAGDADARHQALGRRARAHRRAGRDGRANGRRTCASWLALLEDVPRARRAPSATSSSRRSSAPGRSSPSGSRPTWRRRCARPSATRTGSSPTRRTRRRSRRSAAASTSTRRSSPTSSRSPTGRAGGRAGRAGPAAAQAHRAGHARRLQRRRAALAVAGGPRQPAPGRLGRAPRGARRPADGAEPDRETVKLLVIQRALALRAKRPEAFAGAYTPIDGGGRCARSRAATARCSSSCRSARLAGHDAQAPRRAGGRVARRALRRAAGALAPHAGLRAHLTARPGAARARLTRPRGHPSAP